MMKTYLKRAFQLSDSGAVSYTHLDVYKGQVKTVKVLRAAFGAQAFCGC